MNGPRVRMVAPVVGAVAVLAAVVWRVGGGPFLAGLDAVTVPSLVAAAALGGLSTAGCSWRWVLVARNLGLPLTLRAAVPAYYRSQFLNLALPAGVLGDVHRAASHGREVGDLGRSLRAVVWERTAGQAVQLVVSLVVLVAYPSPVRSWLSPAGVAAAGGALVVLLVLCGPFARGRSRVARTVQAAGADARRALLVPRTAPGIVASSVVVVAAHLGTFLVAARVAGSSASPIRLMPLAILVLLAMALPLSIGGWGAREGVAAPLFAAAGLGAGQGVAVTTTYAVLALAATLPGAVVLVVSALPAVLRRAPVVRPVVPAPRLESAGRG